MPRAKRLNRSVLLVVGMLLPACSPTPSPPVAAAPPQHQVKSPTVVLVSVDTLRADRIGCYGRADAATPTFDRLAAEGARFSAAQTTAPLTLPAHSSLLTGRSLPAHGVFNNGLFALPDSVPTLAEALARHGYARGAFVSAPVLAARYGLARGFERYDDRTGPSAAPGSSHEPERPGNETVAAALEWSAGVGDKPLFLWVHLFEPHRPYHAPAPFFEQFLHDRYQGEVAATDALIDKLKRGLEDQGRGAGLLFWVVADHGESLGEHGEATHGMYLYNATLQIPSILWGPSWGINSIVIDEPTSLTDVAPTLLDYAGATGLAGSDGISLRRLINGEGSTLPRRGVIAESHIPQLEYGWSGLRALVTRERKAIEAPRPELYDRARDRGEQHDLAATNRDELRAALRDLQTLVRAAEAVAPPPADTPALSAEQLDVLRSLGYTASGATAATGALVDPRRTDPKDRAEFVRVFDEAVLAQQARRFAEALGLFARLRQLDPHNPAMLFELGQTQMISGRVDEAIETYRALVARHPRTAGAWYNLARLLDHKRDWAAAETAYRQAIAVEPKTTDARKALASLLHDRGRLREAIGWLEEARDLDPTDGAVKRDLERYWGETRR